MGGPAAPLKAAVLDPSYKADSIERRQLGVSPGSKGREARLNLRFLRGLQREP